MRRLFHGPVLAVAALIVVSGLRAFAAGPTDKSPQTLLAPWTDDKVSPKPVQWYTAAVDLYGSSLQEVEKYEAALAAGKAKSLNRVAVGTTMAALDNLDQYGLRLAAWGEPAGHDVRLRAARLTARLTKVTNEMQSIFEKQIQAALPKFGSLCKTNEKLATQTRKQIANGKLDAAEKAFQKTHRELAAWGLWYQRPQREVPMKIYDDTYGELNGAIAQANEKDAQKTIAALRDKTRPDLTKLPADLQAAAKGLSSAAKVDFGGKQLNGPAVFLAAAKEWHSLERATLRTIALNWAIHKQGSDFPAADPVVKSYAEFRKAILDSFAALIEADAARATDADARELYLAYVKSISDVATATRDDEFVERLTESLQSLADKSQSLAADAAAYRGATDDWMRWRGRAAESAAKATGAEAIKLPVRSGTATKLESEAPVIVKSAADELIDKSMLVSGGLLVAAKGGKPTSELMGHMYARSMSPPPEVQEAIQEELLVSEDQPALSVSAARAIAEAKRGALVEIGGKASGVELVGLVPFFATASPDQRAVIPVGALPELAASEYVVPSQYVLIVADVDPDWVRGRCFFAKLK